MSIVTTQLGQNTYQITLDGELDASGVPSAISASLLSCGWTQFDSFNNGTHLVFRNLCADGVTFKYLGVFVDTSTFKISTTSYEVWNAVTHTGTNEVFTFNRSGTMPFTLTATDIIIMASPRWAIIQTFTRNNPSVWSGVFECVREAFEDTPEAGYPPFAWVCSISVTNNRHGGNQYFSFPRSRSGGTSLAGVADGIQTPFIRLGSQTNLSGQALTSDFTYAWDTSKKIIHSLRPSFGLSELHGKTYGLKGVYNIGSPFNRVSVPVDSDYHFSPAGTATEHWVLGNTAVASTLANTLTSSSPASGYHGGLSTSTLPAASRCAVFTGTNYYVSHASGIVKIDATSTSVQSTASSIPGISTDHGDMVFSGRYVYAASATGVTRIDTTNDSVSTLALAQGAGSLFWDGTWLWAAARTTLVNNSFYKIDPATFTISSTLTQINAVGASIGGITSDFVGNLYTYDTAGKLNKIVISTGNVSLFGTGTPNAQNNLIYNGSNLEAAHVANGQNQTSISNVSNIGVFSAFATFSGHANCVATIPGLTKLPMSKLYNYHLVGITANNTSHTYLASVKGSSQFSNIAAITNTPVFVNSDGARIFGCTSNTFYQYNGINHPDDGSVILNRLLLPK